MLKALQATCLPERVTEIPGPRSRDLAKRLSRVECPQITYQDKDLPIFWERSQGMNVWDVDGNRYLDFTAAFGVTVLGHSPYFLQAAIAEQGTQMFHAMGDIYPARLKVELAELLAELAPGELCQSIFASSGSEAVEAAIKTVARVTGRPRILAFEESYHGLTLGALACTGRFDFQEPFLGQIPEISMHVPFPCRESGVTTAHSLEQVEYTVQMACQDGRHFGGILVEPVQGRGGIRIPDPAFLRGLRAIADHHKMLLIFDEIFTGFGRLGDWFGSNAFDVVPDLMCVGKAMAGGFPISACIGKPSVMERWGFSSGEALHTSTFLGNPLGCAMSLANLKALREGDWPNRVREKGYAFLARLQAVAEEFEPLVSVRGMGLALAVEFKSAQLGASSSGLALAVMKELLKRGIVVLIGGSRANVLTLTPPYIVDFAEMDFLTAQLRDILKNLTTALNGDG